MQNRSTINKTLFTMAFSAILPAATLAQRGNYVRTEVMLDGGGGRSIDNVQFLDGLGRPTVSATNGLGGQGRYTYTAQTYRWGAVSDRWLPAVGTNTLSEPTVDGIASLSAATNGEDLAFSHTECDALGRTLSVLGPGEAWHAKGKTVTTEYITNTVGSVRRYAISDDGKLVDCGHFAARTLGDSLPKACASSFPTGMMELTSRGDTLLTVWTYDRHGNRTVEVRALPGGTLQTTQTDYSFTRKPVRMTQTLRRGSTTSTAVLEMEYNTHNDQPCQTTLAIDGGMPTVVETVIYNDLGQVESICQGSGNIATSYAYNVRGWTTAITGTGLEERLSYHDGTGTPRYNGDISVQQWRTAGDSTVRGYRYSYDTLDRLTTAVYGEGDALTANQGRYNEIVKGYTANGAITGIVRNGRTDSGYGTIDNLTYTLNGNQLERVDDAAAPVLHSGAFDFTDNTVETDGAEYAYNANGALVMDANRGIACIEYDNGNHPVLVQFADGSRTEYVYTTSGEKLRTIHRTVVRDIAVDLGDTRALTKKETLSTDSTDYCGSFIIENGRVAKYLFGNGYYDYGRVETLVRRVAGAICPDEQIKIPVYPTFHYFAKDHLGNIRAVLSKDGTVEQTTHYYPFGAVISDISTNASLQKYKYSGKELDLMHGLNTYDFGARQYDPLLGVWDRIDRNAENYYSICPYSYCGGNPIGLIDIHGNEWGIKVAENGVMIVYANVDLSSTIEDLTEMQPYMVAINTEFSRMVKEASKGRYTGEINFNVPQKDNQLHLSMFWDGSVSNKAGLTMRGETYANYMNANGSLKSPEQFAYDNIHELLHTLRVPELIASNSPISEATVSHIGKLNFTSTPNSASGLVNNVMNYSYYVIDGISYEEQSPAPKQTITPGQLEYMINEVHLQEQGAGRNSSDTYWDKIIYGL